MGKPRSAKRDAREGEETSHPPARRQKITKEDNAKPAPSTVKQAKAAKPKPVKSGESSGTADADKYHSDFYLMKNEPDNFSIDDLQNAENQTCHWEGVRNFQARNILQSMKKGQHAFYYHSNCKVPGVVGIVQIVREAYPDHFAWDKSSPYYDEKSTPDQPRWWMVDVKLVRKLDNIIRLEDIKKHKEGQLKDMQLLTNSRLSVQKVTKEQWEFILGLAGE